MFLDHSILADYYVIGITILVVASFISGFLDSIAGGAGLILVPAFILTGIPPQLALGQEKLVSTIGTFSAIYNYFKNKKIVWKIVAYGIPPALIGAFLGGKIILSIDESIVGMIIFLLIPFGFLISFISKKDHSKKEFTLTKKIMFLVLPLLCLAIGFYDGFFGPGTGSLLIIALSYFIRLPLLQSSATSKIFNLASNVGAFVIFFIEGKMLFLIGIPMIIASIAGNYTGSNLTLRNGEKIIKPLIVTSISILFISLGIKYLGDISTTLLSSIAHIYESYLVLI